MRLPRGICFTCDATVALRRNGMTREHRDPRWKQPANKGLACRGSGTRPRMTDAELIQKAAR